MKHEVLLGIDTIEVVIDTQTILNKNNITFYSSNGNEVGKLVHRQGKKKGYNLILNLPRCVRQNNIQPFSVLDADKIYEITTIVVKQLKKHFGEQLPDLTVKSAEVGATMEIANKKNVQPILNMITGMLLQDKENIVYIACRGKKVGQRYNKVQTLASGINVESIKLPQNSSGRFASKYYDKGLEKDIADEHGIIRVEHIYNKHFRPLLWTRLQSCSTRTERTEHRNTHDTDSNKSTEQNRYEQFNSRVRTGRKHD